MVAEAYEEIAFQALQTLDMNILDEFLENNKYLKQDEDGIKVEKLTKE